MITVITSKGNSTDAGFETRFGRAEWFCVYDSDTREVRFVRNDFAADTGGAGPKAAERMSEIGARRVISGDFGPKAQNLLEKSGIQMVIIRDDHLTVADILCKLSV